MRFRDRPDAGRQLAAELGDYSGREDAIVLGLPRGGVVVAREVADALALPLDVFVVRKLGVPNQPELAFGAIASGGVRVLTSDVVSHAALTEEQIERVVALEREELARREAAYGATGTVAATALLVDDGIATGATMYAAALAVRQAGATRVVCAAPVASGLARARLRSVSDEVRTLQAPDYFGAVANFYDDFDEIDDEAVRSALHR